MGKQITPLYKIQGLEIIYFNLVLFILNILVNKGLKIKFRVFRCLCFQKFIQMHMFIYICLLVLFHNKIFRLSVAGILADNPGFWC